MSVSLLHVGMMKTASSYMQTVWMRHPGICLSHTGTFPVMDAFRAAVRSGQVDAQHRMEICTDQNPEPGQRIVVSNEGFSTAFLNGSPDDQGRVSSYVDYSASMLKQLLPDLENVLIVVRDPISWIHSIHRQSIKEGGFLSLSDFVLQQERFLSHSLDMVNLVESYRRQFSNVMVLPYELLKNDESIFWSRLESFFGIPVPPALEKPLNVSSNTEDTLLLARLNRQGSLMVSGLMGASSYDRDDEKRMITEGYGSCAMWLHRRFIEHASEAEKERMRRCTQGLDTESGFFEVELPDSLRFQLETRFLAYLRSERLIGEVYLQGYEESIAKSASAAKSQIA